MTKIIFISLLLSITAMTAAAQSVAKAPFPPRNGLPTLPILESPEGENQYPDTEGTISKSGYTYKYRPDKRENGDVNTVMLQLFNADNRYLDVELSRNDGSELSHEDIFGSENLFYYATTSTLTFGQFKSIINDCFSDQQKAMLKGHQMLINYRVDPTGKVADVYFSFFRIQPFMYIPVETYRCVELAIKQNLSFTMTPEGQRLNYISLFQTHKF